MKFSTTEFSISKNYKDDLTRKKVEFIKEEKTRKNVFVTMVTSFGVKNNINSSVMDNQVTMDSLFESL
jgi:exoribonuclease R